MSSGVLIYGSTGFVGDAMARLSWQRGYRSITAGRNAARLEAQAAELRLESAYSAWTIRLHWNRCHSYSGKMS